MVVNIENGFEIIINFKKFKVYLFFYLEVLV